MRFHRRYPLLQRWSSPAQRAIIAPQHLSIARFEPAILEVSGYGTLDLIFSAGGSIAVVPFIAVAPEMLLQRENTPLLWPQACRTFEAAAIEAIEDLVLPWLQSLTLARQLNTEALRRFTGEVSQAEFESARSALFLGAASYREAAAAWAPYVYAMRFAQGKRIAIRDSLGATGAAFCASRALNVDLQLENDAIENLAARWFGCSFASGAPEEPDVAIYAPDARPVAATVEIALDRTLPDAREVAVAQPVPIDVLFSFNAQDSCAIRRFSVRVNRAERTGSMWNASPEPAQCGGSAGTILLLMRDDWMRAPDADTEEARALALRLQAEGFTAIFDAASAADLQRHKADLVHAFPARNAAQFGEPLARFKTDGVPVVVTPALSPATQHSMSVPGLLRRLFSSAYEAHIEENLEVLDVVPPAPFEGRDEALAAVLALADSIVSSEPYVRELPVRSVEALTGPDEYVFAHTRIEARANLTLLARAAAEQGRTLAVAGPVLEYDAYRTLREILFERFIYCGEPEAAELGGLYSAARVYADVSWSSYGAARSALARAFGCRLLTVGNPASITSIGYALSQAWGAPQPPAATPNDAFLAVIAAYASAGQRAGAPA